MQQQKRGPKSTSGASWVPSEAKGARGKPPAPRKTTNSSDSSQWLPSPLKRRPTRNGRSRANAAGNGNGNGNGNRHSADVPTSSRRTPQRHKLPKRATSRERWFFLRLRRAQRRVDERDQEIERLRERIGELEAELRERSRPDRPRSARKPRSRNGRLDLNDASFEQLRTLGLTVTQTSRLIAYRDTSGGFNSFGEIEELQGFGKATLALLRSRTRTNGS